MPVVEAWPHWKLQREVERCRQRSTLAYAEHVRGDPLFVHFFIDDRRLAVNQVLDAQLRHDLGVTF